jgi:hypothetical protein
MSEAKVRIVVQGFSYIAAFFLQVGAALSLEVADGKINVQSVCAQNTRYMRSYLNQRDGNPFCGSRFDTSREQGPLPIASQTE